MASPKQWISLKAFRWVVDSFDMGIVADFFNQAGKKKFGDAKDQYLEIIQRKLSNLVFEIGRRIGK